MKGAALLLLAGLMASPALAADWTPPDVDKLPNDAFGQTVRQGRDLFVHTTATMGPDAADPAKRYSGNGLECQSCHLEAGTKKFGMPMMGIWGIFPTYIAREDAISTLADRINGCMERSMNGKALPFDGPEMKALLSYIRFISAGAPTGKSVDGRGTPDLPLPTAAADPAHGAKVFTANCSVCHQANGQGLKFSAEDAAKERHRYQFPPLWGPDSYNDGAGMGRPITAAKFIDANMPNGTDYTHPVLSAQDAYDVAAYVDSQSRPHLAKSDKDYPNKWLKPVDATYPPFLGPFPPEQHLTGPWQPMQAWLKENKPKPGAAQ